MAEAVTRDDIPLPPVIDNPGEFGESNTRSDFPFGSPTIDDPNPVMGTLPGPPQVDDPNPVIGTEPGYPMTDNPNQPYMPVGS